MYGVQLQWLSFNVNIDVVSAWVAANAGTNFTGQTSADSVLTLWFTAPPTDDQVTAINLYWSELNLGSPEATGYRSQAQIAAASTTLKASCLGVAWDSMTAAQQKMVLGLPLTNQDLGL